MDLLEKIEKPRRRRLRTMRMDWSVPTLNSTAQPGSWKEHNQECQENRRGGRPGWNSARGRGLCLCRRGKLCATYCMSIRVVFAIYSTAYQSIWKIITGEFLWLNYTNAPNWRNDEITNYLLREHHAEHKSVTFLYFTVRDIYYLPNFSYSSATNAVWCMYD